MSFRKVFFAFSCLPALLCAVEENEEIAKICPPFHFQSTQNQLQAVKKEPPPPCRALLASARPCRGIDCNSYAIASVSFLYWQSKMWGLEFVSKSFVPNTPEGSSQTFDQKTFIPDFAWRPGVKANLGCYLPYDGWDLIGNWTFNHSEFTSLKKHFQSEISPSGIGIVPLWRYPFFDLLTETSSAPIRYRLSSANWKIGCNVADLELGRLFFPAQALPMRLHLGLKSAWIVQHYHVAYINGNSVSGFNTGSPLLTTFQLNSSHFAFSSHQWGIGPRTGIESRWKVWRGFNLIANGSFSVLCSFFDLHTKYVDVFEAPTLTNASMMMKEKFHELTPMVESMLGFDWGTCIGKNRPVYFDFSIGFEWQYWWSVNHARRNYVQSLPGETFDMRGDLQTQGLTATAKLDF